MKRFRDIPSCSFPRTFAHLRIFIARIGLRRTFAALICAAVAAPSYAAFHLFRIDQIYSNADGTVQYVVMHESTGSDGENFWAGNLFTATSAAGMQQFQFPANLPSSSTASKRVLIATSGFAALGLVTPDYTIPNGFVPKGGGTISYASGVDHVSFGALPSDGATAIDRNGNAVPATPTNFAGATATLTAAPPPMTGPDIDQQGLTGSWFKAAESGQGIELEIFPNFVGAGVALVDGAWFTFDVAPAGGADHQRWYTFSGNGQSGQSSAPVTLLQNVGGNFDAAPITNAVPVGTGTITFTDCGNGTFSYAFTDGSNRSGSIALTRIAPNVTCVVSGTPATNADFGLSGNWFDPTTSGQGFVFEVNPQAPVVFFAWYTYSPTGQMAGAAGQRWFTGQGTFTAGTHTAPLTLFETTGGLFDTTTPASQATVPVGTATVTFASCTSAQLQFNFTGGTSAGHAGMINLSRVGPVPTGCAVTASDPPPMMPPGYGGGPYGP